MASVALISLNACSGDDDNNNNGGGNNDPIVATWKLYGDMVDGQVINGNIESCDDEIYKFKSNGQLEVTDKACGEPTDSYTMNWERVGDNFYKFIAQQQVIDAYYVEFSEDGQYAYLFGTADEMMSHSYAEVYKKS